MQIAMFDDEGQGFVLKNRDGIIKIAFARLEYVEVVNKSLFFYLIDGVVWEVAAALADIEGTLLCRPEFLKVHRSYLVNLRYVQSVNGEGIVTSNGHTIPVARQRRSQVQGAYMDFLSHEGEKQAQLPSKMERAMGQWRILLVDDEPAVRAFWAGILQEHGCTVQQAASGEEAIRLAGDEAYDCVLLDVALPGEDGFLLCRELCEAAQAPVIFLSCITEADKQVEGFAAGGADYITKDTPAGLFWAKVEARIRLAMSGRTRFRYGPLLLDMAGRRALIGEKELDLMPVEFELLWRLSEQAGHIFTPEELSRSIWGKQPWDGGQALQRHMSRLRRKLDKAWQGHHFIETVWGQGYRFVPPGC